MPSKQEIIDSIPIDSIIKIKRILDNIDTTDRAIVDKYNQLKNYDEKLRKSESKAAVEAYDLVDDILLKRYISNSEVSEWRYECSLRVILSLMIYGCINISLDEVTKDEFILIRTTLKSWYKQLKKVVK